MTTSSSFIMTILAAFAGLCLVLSSSDVAFVSAYSQQQQQQHRKPSTSKATTTPSRRTFFASVTAAVATAAAATAPANAVLSSKYCAYGEGNDCEDLAEGNPYILELQRKSAENKVANVESAKNAFYAKNYPDWFAAVGKTMVQKESDGTFIVVDDAELAKLRAENKISVKTPTTMGGRVTDVTQKPMLVLKE
mmetsp:Transcript_1249/g.2644  ORF Transcript_1249/g.2644 Transcript_1249/m.2644 type:complete len:193 (-) Transcript_1249:1722-2300(-)